MAPLAREWGFLRFGTDIASGKDEIPFTSLRTSRLNETISYTFGVRQNSEKFWASLVSPRNFNRVLASLQTVTLEQINSMEEKHVYNETSSC